MEGLISEGANCITGTELLAVLIKKLIHYIFHLLSVKTSK